MIESQPPVATGDVPATEQKPLTPYETEGRDSNSTASESTWSLAANEENKLDQPAIEPAFAPMNEPEPDLLESSAPGLNGSTTDAEPALESETSERASDQAADEQPSSEQVTSEQLTSEQAADEATSETSVAAPSASPTVNEMDAGEQGTSAMAEAPFAELLEQSFDRVRTFRPGDRLRGVIQRIDDSFAYLDYGGPREAVIASPELRDGGGNLTFGVGERIDVTVGEVGEQLLVHLLVRKTRDRSVLKQAFASSSPIEGKVTGINRGGFEVQVAGFRAFCPISQIDRIYCTDQQTYLGQTLPFRIIEYKEGGRRIVVSRRVLLEEDRKREAAETRARLGVGDELDGTVVRIQPFGAFVDIGGLDGLVHVSELRHGRVTNPAQVVEVGQKLRVKVIGIENLGADKGERISLSARALEDDPWAQVGDHVAPGATVQGKVLRLMNYGAFVEVSPGVEGLLHLSEIGDKRLHHPREALSEGAAIDVRVLEIDRERRRLSLSMRSPDAPRQDAGSSEAQGAKLQAGMSIVGTVSSIKPYGVFVRIHEPVVGVDGLLPAEETGLPRGSDLGQTLPVGAEVRADVLRVDALGRVRLTQRPPGERETSAVHPGAQDGESGRERRGGRDRGPKERRAGRDRDASPGGQDFDANEREARRGSRRGPHKETRGGAPRESDEGEEERREAKSGSSGLGIMAKAFRRVLDNK